MKKMLLAVLAVICVTVVTAQQNKKIPHNGNIYYYYKNQKIYFSVTYKQIVVGVADGYSINDFRKSFSAQAKMAEDSVKQSAVKNQFVIKLNDAANENESGKIIAENLKSNGKVLYSRPCVVGINGKLFSYGNDFVVKLKVGTSKTQLDALALQNNCTVLRAYMFDKSTFILGAGTLNGYDGLKTANTFFESGLFEYAEPDFEIYDAIETPNDPLYYLQWDHKNTGSADQYNGVPGADMNVDSAWLITQGKGTIKVAVIDEGVDTGHVELKSNLLQGFDCVNLTSNPGDGRPLSSANAHGTCCAGIIAALANNGIGVAGIAPKCKIIPINLAQSNGYFTTISNIAAGIDYAWMNDADVLTNSWGGGGPSSILDDAIHRAVTQGRNGKGCIVFFAAGNNNNGLSYPGLNTDVVAVGGINMCNQRKDPNSCDGEYWWGASYGAGLGVVAPCVKIPTTDISGSGGYSTDDYELTFNGTSAATPHAAAVAALIFSVNASLKGEDVKTIIENTADKIPNYNFKMTSGYKNGTWNNEMGYGRVDAYHAVLAAQSGKFCNAEIAALGETRFCNGGNVKLHILNKDNSATYNWYQDNNLVSSGSADYNAKKTANYYISVLYTNGCSAVSAPINVTAVKNTIPLVADAGKSISLCSGSNGARIGGMPSGSSGAAFLNDQRLYGMDWYTNNLVRINLNNPSDIDTVASNMVSTSDFNNGYFFAGGDFTPFGYYAITRLTNNLYRVDTVNGSKQLIKTIAPSQGNWQGLAWDPKGEKLYAMSSFGTYSQLYTVDLITGDITPVVTIPVYYLVWIAFDNHGNLYALSTNYRYIYKIDKTTGAATALPNVSDNGLNYAQDADFDPISDSLYLTAFSARQNYTGDLRIANTTTGTVNTVGTIGHTPFNEIDASAISGYTYNYSWSPAGGLSDIHDANPFANPLATTNYTLTVTDLCGNQATSKVKVTVGASKPKVKITSSKDTVCSGSKIKLKATANSAYVYQWYLNGNKIEGANDSFYTAKDAGTYTVRASFGIGGCDSLSNPFIIYSCFSKTNDFISKNNGDGKIPLYSLFPNPANNVINIKLPQNAKPSVITVYDMQGRVVAIKKMDNNNSTEQVDISKLAKGSYRITWQQGSQVQTWKVVKQ